MATLYFIVMSFDSLIKVSVALLTVGHQLRRSFSHFTLATWLRRRDHAAIYRRSRTIPFCRISDGNRSGSQTVRSSILDLSGLTATDVAIHSHKSRSVFVRDLSRTRFGSRAFSLRLERTIWMVERSPSVGFLLCKNCSILLKATSIRVCLNARKATTELR
jgi:hypothetical protein